MKSYEKPIAEITPIVDTLTTSLPDDRYEGEIDW